MMSVSAALSKLFASPAGKGAASRVLNGRLYLADVPFTTTPRQRGARAGVRAPRRSLLRALDRAQRQLGAQGRGGHGRARGASRSPSSRRSRTRASSSRAAGSTAATAAAAYRAWSTTSSSSTSTTSRCCRWPTSPRSTCASSACRPSRASPSRRSPISRPASSCMQFRPDEELKRLAARAVELGLGRAGRDLGGPRRRRSRSCARRRERPRVGRRVRAARKRPWFSVSMGTGLFHHERAWIDDLSVPWAAIARLRRRASTAARRSTARAGSSSSAAIA